MSVRRELRLTPCQLCGKGCIPMADYDLAVCIGCDVKHEAIDLRAAITPAPPVEPPLPKPTYIFDRIRQELRAEWRRSA